MKYPKYVIIENEKYEINTDFRVALKCEKVARNNEIGKYERALAIIYLLFGDKGINNEKHYDKLIEYAKKYLLCEEEFNDDELKQKKSKQDYNDLDFEKCEGLIKTSFKYDYNYDPYAKDYLHWYDFYTDLCNLSVSEFGNCCALNRVVYILNQDAKKIKDIKERDKLIDIQKKYRKKYCVNNKVSHTKEQKDMANKIYGIFGLRRE